MKYKIENGFDHFNNSELWRVTGEDNDFVHDWRRFECDAENDLAAVLQHDGALKQAESREEAGEALSAGLHVFRVHPMAEDDPQLVKKLSDVENYTAESILIEIN